MRKTYLLFIFIFAPILQEGSRLTAQEHVFLPMDASRLKAIGMAAAYQAVRDDLAAISYNPASYSVYREQKDFRLTFFFAPVSPFLIYRNPQKFFGSQFEHSDRTFAAVLALVRAINLTYKDLDFGLLVGEPGFSQTEILRERQAFHVNGVDNNHYHAAVLRIRLAEQVAIGASLYVSSFLDDEGERDRALSASYGVTLQPNDYLRVGLSLFSASAKLGRTYEFIDEKYNDALALGLAFLTPWKTTIAVDIRNLTVNQDVQGERLLAGVEQTVFDQLALRAGVQYNTNDGSFTQTFGFSVLDLNHLWPDRRQFKHNNYAINYAVIRKKLAGIWHLIHGFDIRFRL